MFLSHNLVRLGYSHESVMDMDEDDIGEWIGYAKKYNTETGKSEG